ncbi:UDP-N-acetylmuramoylalanine--D-glutamate ligase [Neolewinella xylanilytica]|uniref:UDP-N-acetylmuramoylalanine--D-glutamate ligase n=1 Tax=Neolewinella xylanilytica TaxID=1514080 RepID=A0A2S6I4C0_9BACT|nr:UDP-N-acetylmuramoyl-L-alanine--D-glutamate ligase [Neolewinella xylanilytica]PPK86020.1 UDP-N-acetylmuramoylalanine--D-glutamate ligase [Neolewinella xylanilytica]
MSKQLVILGAGESGASAARLGKREGYAVFVSDAGVGSETYLAELREAGIEFETGSHSHHRILQADIVVKSPGIPDTAGIVKTILQAGIPVISEIELAYRFVPTDSTIVGITGSNGKTTTTMLTHHLLQAAGERVLAGGNLGDSFARLLVDHEPQDIYVLELSSFQLDGTVDFRPDIATILNITPDHLDRYNYQLEKYADSKFRIGRRQRKEDHLLLLDDPQTIAPALRRNKVDATISLIDPETAIDGTRIAVDGHEYELKESPLRGRHNAMNALFAVRIARLLGVSQEEIQIALESFVPAPHRMEVIPTHDGRTWINDSKATNVDSTYFALEAMDGPTVWIAGGTDKGNDYAPLREVLDGKVHTLICLGADNEKLKKAFGDIDRVVECRSAERAVELASEYAAAGDRILLSPACASFDLFKNYVDRGDQFRAHVKRIVA